MINAGEVFAGAAAGGPVGPVFDVLREVVEKSFAFNPTLESVKSTVDSLTLLIPQIDDHNTTLGGNRAGEVEKLKEIMEEGKRLIEELLEVNEWSCLKAHYTDQLVELDESLKRHLEILQVQGVIDVKEALVVAKDTNKDVKEHRHWLQAISVTSEENTNQLVRFEATLKTGLSDLQKGQETMIDRMIRRIKWNGMENKVGSLTEAARLGATLQELDDAVFEETLISRYPEIVMGRLEEIGKKTRGIFELIEWKREENKEISYISTEELKNFRVKIEEGVKLVRNLGAVLDWTEAVKSFTNNKFLHLDETLERLYNRLNGIHPFKWSTGKCGRSCGTTSMKDSDIINDRFYHSDDHV